MIQSKNPSDAFSLFSVVAKAHSTVSYCIAAERDGPYTSSTTTGGGVKHGALERDGAETADRRPLFEIKRADPSEIWGSYCPSRLRSQSAGLGGR